MKHYLLFVITCLLISSTSFGQTKDEAYVKKLTTEFESKKLKLELPLKLGKIDNKTLYLDENRKPMGARKASLGSGVTEDNFMRHVVANEKTSDPNYPGTHLTTTSFPLSYLNTFVSDPICKLSYMFLRFFYCASPWMQVVIFLLFSLI